MRQLNQLDTNDVTVMDNLDARRKDYRSALPMETINILRGRIFCAVIDHLCDEKLPAVQKAVGVWPWHDDIPVPERRTVTMFTNGTLNFSIKTTAGNIFFGIWMFPGEIRVGFRIPHGLVPAIHDVVSTALDGKITPCPRIMDMGDTGTFYDWIFRDRFADIALWEKALTDDNCAAMIADSLRSITIHLYMSVINAAIIYGGCIPTPSGTLMTRNNAVDIMIDFDVDETTAVESVQEAGLNIVSTIYQPSDRSIIIVRVNHDSPMEYVDDALSKFNHTFTLKVI